MTVTLADIQSARRELREVISATPSLADERLTPGEVRDAIVSYLGRRRTAADPAEIIKAVESEMGRPVPAWRSSRETPCELALLRVADKVEA